MKFSWVSQGFCVLVFALTGCATPDQFIGYPGQARQAAEISIVRGKSAELHEVDGVRLEHPEPYKYYGEAHLLPGHHRVTAYRRFGVSVLLVLKGYVEATRTFSLNMEAGHVYELHADRTTGPGFRLYFWVEDATTRSLVAGEKLN